MYIYVNIKQIKYVILLNELSVAYKERDADRKRERVKEKDI